MCMHTHALGFEVDGGERVECHFASMHMYALGFEEEVRQKKIVSECNDVFRFYTEKTEKY